MNDNEKLADLITDIQYIHCELQLQPVQAMQANRLKELQDGLNVIKQCLDEYEKLSERQDRLLQKRRDRKSK